MFLYFYLIENEPVLIICYVKQERLPIIKSALILKDKETLKFAHNLHLPRKIWNYRINLKDHNIMRFNKVRNQPVE